MPASPVYDVILDGQGYMIDLESYRGQDPSQFAPKTRVGDAGFGDLARGSSWAQSAWGGGFGFLEWDVQHQDRFADGSSIDPSYGDVRCGRPLASVLAADIYAFAYYKGSLYGITTGDDKVYTSTDGISWSQSVDLSTAAIGSTATSLRSIWTHAQYLLVGSGSGGQIFSFDGTTWALYLTIPNATAIRAGAQVAFTNLNVAYSYVSAADVDGTVPTPVATLGASTLFPVQNATLVGGTLIASYQYIDAILQVGGTTYVAAVSETNSVSGALFALTGTTASPTVTLVQKLPDNAISSFFVYHGDVLAGSRTGGIIWKVTESGLEQVFQLPELAMPGTPPAYTEPIRGMASNRDRLYVPFTDLVGPSIYQFDGVGWVRFATGGSGAPRSVAAFNDALLLATATAVYRAAATYQTGGTLITPWFDADLASIEKPLARAVITHAPLATGQSIAVDYALDDATGWTALGTSSTVGASTATFLFPTAIKGRRIRFRFTLALTTNTATPKLRSVVMDYRLAPDLKKEWQFQALLQGSAQYPLIRADDSDEPLTGGQLSDALWASRAKKQALAFTDIDGEARTVWFEGLTEEVDREFIRARQATRGIVRLVEA